MREVEIGWSATARLVAARLTFTQPAVPKALGKLDAEMQARSGEWQDIFDRRPPAPADGLAESLAVEIAGPGPTDSVRWFASVDDPGALGSATRRKPRRSSTSAGAR